MNKNFLLLWQGQFVSQAGSQVAGIGIMLWVLDATGSATFMGLLMMASSIPGVILGPIGGTFADRYSRKKIIVITDLLRGVAILAFAAMVFFMKGAVDAKLAVLFCVAIFNGINGAFFNPAIGASIPDIVPRKDITGANSWIQSSGQIAGFIGQGLGGVLYRLWGAPLVFLIDGLSFLFSSLSETFIEIPNPAEKPAIKVRDVLKVFKDETLEGFRFIWGNPGLRAAVLMAGFLNLFLTPFFVLMPLFVKDFLNATSDWFGYIIAGLGVGSLIGYIVAGVVRREGRVRMITHLIFLVTFSSGFVIFSLLKSAPAALVTMFAIGLVLGVVQVDLNTIIMLGVPTEIRGRVFGFLGTLAAGLMPIGMALSGVIADGIGGNIPAIYLSCGIITVLISIAVSFSRGYRKFLTG